MPSPPAPPVDNGLAEGFRGWLAEEVSGDTAAYYAGVVSRRGWPPRKRKHVKAWRRYVQYLFSVGRLDWQALQQYLAFLRLGGSERVTQAAVPADTVLKYREAMAEAGLADLYVILLGGARLKHALRALAEWRPEEVVRHPTGRLEPRLACGEGWCRYYLGVREGTKRADYVYFPRPSGGRLRVPRLEYRKLKDRLRRLGVQAKMFRKYANQELERAAHEANIRLDAVNLIMSRELSVSGSSYLNTRDWADELFARYVARLRAAGLV